MWAIKILNGPQTGKIFPLKKGNNVMGRAPNADIRIADNGVSKNHAQIFVTNDKVIISDLKSSNGTFVNGIQVQNHGLKTGDKILVHDTIITIFQLPDNVVFTDNKALPGSAASTTARALAQTPASPTGMTAYQGANAMSLSEAHAASAAPTAMAMAAPQSQAEQIMKKAENYIEDVAMPPIYKAAERVDFKYVLMGFSLLFIFMVTFLAIVPLSQITNESVLNESTRRVLTLARNLAQMNRNAMAENSEIALSTDFIEHETGVEKAYIISASSGGILAPSSMVGRYVRDPFIVSLKNTTDEATAKINDTQVAASVPIKIYNPQVGESIVTAYAVVVYNIDPLSVDFNRTLSLFIQIFLIAAVMGAFVYFVQYRVMIRPLKLLNISIDKALQEGTSDVHVPFQLKVFQDLVSNINSALSRISNDFTGTDDVAGSADKSLEASEVVQLFPIPSFAIDPQSLHFITANAAVQGHPLFDGADLYNGSIQDLTDKSLFESLKDLATTCVSTPNTRHSHVLPSRGSESFEISAKAIINGNKPSYILFTVMQIIEEDEA